MTFVMPSPPAGPVPARISLRTNCGSSCAITWAIMPPIEKPSRSTRSRPSARMNVTASLAIAWIVSGVLPVEAPTPRLSKVITRCCAAMPSTTRGSQLSRTAARWVRKTTGTPVVRAELAVGEAHSTGRDGAGQGVPVGGHRVVSCCLVVSHAVSFDR